MKVAVRVCSVVMAVLVLAMPVSAQRYRGDRRVVKGGLMQKIDSLAASRPDTLAAAGETVAAEPLSDSVKMRLRDSLAAVLPDSLVERQLETIVAALEDAAQEKAREAAARRAGDTLSAQRTDTLSVAGDGIPAALLDSLSAGLPDTLAAARLDSLSNALADSTSLAAKRKERKPFLSDSMSLSKVCWVSAVLPGYGQIYNKQYWKLPILYSTLGASIGMFAYENGRYKPLKRQFDAMTNNGLSRTPELDRLQTNMIRSNTRRELYLGAMIVSYLYFLGDAAVCYSTNEVSNIKRATTLAVICPGAGQIYNKSYWRVPIVLGGFATTIYCVDWNNRGYQRFKKAYRLRADYDKNPEAYPSGSTDEFGGRYSATFLKNLRDSYRRNRDLCIILTAGLYILQIVDAHVDAHLRDYDISDDLSMNIAPMVDYAYSPAAGRARPTFGMNISINF